MGIEFFKSVLDALKVKPRHLVAVAAVLAFLRLADAQLLDLLGVRAVAEDHRAVIGLGLLGCVALLGVEACGWLLGQVHRLRIQRQYKVRVRQHLCALTEDEKQVLRFYVAQQTRTSMLCIDDGVVQGLVAKGLIQRVSSLGDLVDGFAHNIGELAWQELQKNPALLEGTTNTYRTGGRGSW